MLELAALGLGAALAAWYFVFERSLPRGPEEFVTWPPLEPLPFAPLRGFTVEQLARLGGRLVLLGPALVLLSWSLARLLPWRAPEPRELRRLALLAGALGLAVCAWLMLGVLRGRALLDDELTYAMQAQLLSEGRLTEDTVPRWGGELFTIWTRRGATGKYLFGEPLVQAAGYRVGLPALLHLPLFALTLWAWFLAVRRRSGESTAAFSVLLLALSPMLLFTSATGLSHATSLACVALAGLGLALAEDGLALPGALLAGSALGFLVTVRPQVAIPIGAVLGGALLLLLVRRRKVLAAGVLALSAGAFVLLVALYNRFLTGSYLALPWDLFRPSERYGFGRALQGDEFVHDGWTALENLVVTAVRLNGWWLGWPLSLGLLAVWWYTGRRLEGARLWLLTGAALVLFHVPYYTTGVSDTGPVYAYELVLPLSLLGGFALGGAFERWPRATAAVLAVHLVVGTASFVVEQGARVSRMVALVHGQSDAVLEQIPPPALLLYESAPQESIRLGWINSGFPRRERSERAAVVIYPRSGARPTRELRTRYATRHCYYYRVEPERLRPELRRCEDAEALLARPYRLEGPALALRSTAMLRGWLVPKERAGRRATGASGA